MVFVRLTVVLTLAAFMSSPSVTAQIGTAVTAAWHQVPPPDQSGWSSKRLAMFAEAKESINVEPYAVLEIPSAAIEVAVYPDTVRGSLEGGVAWVSGTAAPGARGNAVIAGHRDGYFRTLEGIDIGTRVHVRTASRHWSYKVSEIEIVDALDMRPLDPSDDPTLTLITCYPFRYQGYAPDRYIVRATIEQG